MPRRRAISTEISTDARVATLAANAGPLAVLLYTWAIPHADDWGRLTGDAVQFRLQVCPGLDVTVKQVDEALDAIAAAGLWHRYEVGGVKVIAFPPAAWYRHQSYIPQSRRQEDRSRFPAPPAETVAEAPEPGTARADSAPARRASPQNAAEGRDAAQSAAEGRTPPQIPSSLSLSPSPPESSLGRGVLTHTPPSTATAGAPTDAVASAPAVVAGQPPIGPQGQAPGAAEDEQEQHRGGAGHEAPPPPPTPAPAPAPDEAEPYWERFRPEDANVRSFCEILGLRTPEEVRAADAFAVVRRWERHYGPGRVAEALLTLDAKMHGPQPCGDVRHAIAYVAQRLKSEAARDRETSRGPGDVQLPPARASPQATEDETRRIVREGVWVGQGPLPRE
jgi:hypothetical protein